MKNKKIGFLIIIILLLIITAGAYYLLNNNNDDEIDNQPVLVDSIKNYDYKLEDRDTNLYKEIYDELKETLEKDEIDYKKYAELISKLYIVDLYTISNKVTKYDVGGLEFVLPSAQDNYKLKVEDTLYKYVEDNSNAKRNQELPEVESIEIVDTSETDIKVNEEEYHGYTVELKWNYKKDLGYDTNAIVNLIKDNNKVYVIEQKTTENE